MKEWALSYLFIYLFNLALDTCQLFDEALCLKRFETPGLAQDRVCCDTQTGNRVL